MAERIAAASRLMGNEAGRRNRRRKNEKPITTTQSGFMLSTAAVKHARPGSRHDERQERGHSPCAKVSRVPKHMMRKPQK